MASKSKSFDLLGLMAALAMGTWNLLKADYWEAAFSFALVILAFVMPPERVGSPVKPQLPLLWIFLLVFAVWRTFWADYWGAALGAILAFCAFVRPGPSPSPTWKKKAFVLGVAALTVNIVLAVVATLHG